VRNPRNTDSSRLRQRLQTSGNIHAVTKEVARANHHITHMDANTKIDVTIG